jgi:hypothetical protein
LGGDTSRRHLRYTNKFQKGEDQIRGH